MNGLRKELPKRAWLRIRRVTGIFTAISVAISIILTNVIMEVFSAGINVQGLSVSIIMPIALGTPMTFFLMLKHEQLRHANQQLEHLASTDWLTACLNRGAFTRAAISQLERRRGGGDAQGALLIIDADDFKHVNDRFGHDVGDQALQLIADAIRNAVRPLDLVGRLGGEEFGVFLVSVGSKAADQFAERIRSAVAQISLQDNDIACPLSVSIGGATYRGAAQFHDLYRLADKHLYDAKSTGRDRVSIMQAA